MSTWECPKCSTRNGQFDKKCFNCGKKQPSEFVPSKDLLDAHESESAARKVEEKNELNRIGNRLGLGITGGSLAAIAVGALWFFGNIQGSGPIAIVSVLISILYGSAIGSAVWLAGRGFSSLYGIIGAALALLSSLISQALIYTHFLAIYEGYDPKELLLSFNPSVYIAGFSFGFVPVDIIFYILVCVSAWWFSWRSGPDDSRLSLLTGSNN